MTLNEWVKVKGCPTVIEGCSRAMLPEFFKSLNYQVGAEIGVAEGHFTEMFCKVGLKMYAIDPWVIYGGNGILARRSRHHNISYQNTVNRLSKYGDLATIIKKTSEEALKDIPDNSLNFVYIDGNHELPYVVYDIFQWSKKVKSGGVISGHDYFNLGKPGESLTVHVKSAVDACVQVLGIDNWWVINRIPRNQPRTNDDKYPSWMWFNP